MEYTATDIKILELEARLEKYQLVNQMLFGLIIRQNDNLYRDTMESLRRILQHPQEGNPPLPPSVLEQLQTLRDLLLIKPDPELSEVLSKPAAKIVK